MTDREPVKPTVEMPLREAIQDMTGFEVLGIERRYGRSLEDLGGVRTLVGCVWVYENRDRPKNDPVSWTAIEGRSLRELGGYFAADDTDNDDQGKGGSETPSDSPTSA